MGKAVDFNDKYVIDALNLANPREAAEYLAIALDDYEEDGDLNAFLIALRRIIEVKGGITELSRKTGLNRQNIHRILNNKVNPKFNTLKTILSYLGFKLTLREAN
jgi:probable addiction module antidote protein